MYLWSGMTRFQLEYSVLEKLRKTRRGRYSFFNSIFFFFEKTSFKFENDSHVKRTQYVHNRIMSPPSRIFRTLKCSYRCYVIYRYSLLCLLSFFFFFFNSFQNVRPENSKITAAKYLYIYTLGSSITHLRTATRNFSTVFASGPKSFLQEKMCRKKKKKKTPTPALFQN